jgi:hypothetical protein
LIFFSVDDRDPEKTKFLSSCEVGIRGGIGLLRQKKNRAFTIRMMWKKSVIVHKRPCDKYGAMISF